MILRPCAHKQTRRRRHVAHYWQLQLLEELRKFLEVFLGREIADVIDQQMAPFIAALTIGEIFHAVSGRSGPASRPRNNQAYHLIATAASAGM